MRRYHISWGRSSIRRSHQYFPVKGTDTDMAMDMDTAMEEDREEIWRKRGHVQEF